jgi:hypothetical protein
MGMDVYGTSGNYFRNSVWGWHPLADYIVSVAPTTAAACKHWHTNSGGGLDAEGAKTLALVLQKHIDSGHTAVYERRYKEWQASLPNETCHICNGTGVRSDAIGRESLQHLRAIPIDPSHPRSGEIGWCNGCDGKGYNRNFKANYPFSVENVQEFADFCRDSGGFEIW